MLQVTLIKLQGKAIHSFVVPSVTVSGTVIFIEIVNASVQMLKLMYIISNIFKFQANISLNYKNSLVYTAMLLPSHIANL